MEGLAAPANLVSDIVITTSRRRRLLKKTYTNNNRYLGRDSSYRKADGSGNV